MLKSLSALFLLATSVVAQGAFISLPTFNQTVSAGSNLTVQVIQPDSLTNYEEVAIVIGVQSCPNGSCFPPSEVLGTVLYNGPYDPQFYSPPYYQPYQNFTVQIPSTVPAGTALIGVLHLELVGAGFESLFESLNQTITIV